MQIVRSYDLSVKILQEKEDIAALGFLKEGAPINLCSDFEPFLLQDLSSWSQAVFGMARQLPWNHSETLVSCSMIIAESKSWRGCCMH